MTEHVAVPSNPEDVKKLKTMLVEATHCMQRSDDEKESIKEIIADAYARFDIPKKALRKLATTMYKRNYDDVQAENDDFEYLYEALVEGKTGFKSSDEEAA